VPEIDRTEQISSETLEADRRQPATAEALLTGTEYWRASEPKS
jgi:hypothetical protein